MLGWCQTELAAQAGVSLITIKNVEAVRCHPSRTTLRKIAQALEAHLSFTSDGLRVKK